MNLFNEAIYKNHLAHTAEGTKWGKHKYLYITQSGRYVYPEDVQKGKSAQQFRSRQINDQIRSAHVNGTTKTPEDIRRQQINDQIKSAHQGGTSRNPEDMRKAKTLSDMSGMKLSSTHKLNRLAKEYGTNSKEFKEHLKILSEGDDEQAKKMLDVINGNKAVKTSGTAAGSKIVSTKTEESKKMGLSDDDLKNMEINTQATNRDEVLKNIALRVIRGDYGNGADRKAKLGNYYDEVQKRVNELTKSGEIQRQGSSGGSTGSSSTSSVAKQLSDMSGMKSSATQKLIDLYQKEGAGSDAFEKELKILSEGDDDQAKKMIAIINKSGIKSKKSSVKHYDLTEGGNYLMHWGKKRRSGRYRFGTGDRPYQHESNKRYMRKNSSFSDRRSMTDEELVAAIKRAKNEVELYRAERDNRSQGQRFVEDVLTSVGKNVIIGAATGGLKYAGKKFVEGALGEADLANAMFGGGGGKKKDKKGNKK